MNNVDEQNPTKVVDFDNLGPFEERYLSGQGYWPSESGKGWSGPEGRAARYREVVEYFYHWRQNGGSNMASQIFAILSKADRLHMEAFFRGFPEYVVVFEKWQRAESEEKFFKAHGLTLR